MTPRTDVCSRCEEHRRNIQQARIEADKGTAVDVFRQHHDATPAGRDYYRQATLDAKAELDACTSLQQSLNTPCARDLQR